MIQCAACPFKDHNHNKTITESGYAYIYFHAYTTQIKNSFRPLKLPSILHLYNLHHNILAMKQFVTHNDTDKSIFVQTTKK